MLETKERQYTEQANMHGWWKHPSGALFVLQDDTMYCVVPKHPLIVGLKVVINALTAPESVAEDYETYLKCAILAKSSTLLSYCVMEGNDEGLIITFTKVEGL